MDRPRNPIFTIITVCLNAGSKLLDTVYSVTKQSHSSWELIIKDGGSTDGSIMQIEKNDDRIKLLCKKDTGIYDAMNQAISEAVGDYLIFLNAGDLFASESVLSKTARFIESQQADIYYGNYINSSGDYCILPHKLTLGFMYSSFLCHQSIFYKRKSIVDYDKRFKLLADHNLNIECLKEGKVFCFMPFAVCIYEGGGISENHKYKSLYQKELRFIRHIHYSNIERFLYHARYLMTMPHLRAILYSERSPILLRKCYRKLVSKLR